MTAFLQNLFVFLRALPSLLKFIVSGPWLKKGDEPSGNVQVSKDFFGVGVASSEEQACDDFVVERLKELGVNQVRLDFSTNSRTTYQERFLRRLIDEKFRVCLHIVQSRSEAEQMHKDKETQDTWGNFMAEILAAYGRQVEIIEIGSTGNRCKWAGYTLPGYLTAWQIAYKAASAHNCRLAAPNITDFEPVYNIAILSAMKQKKILPVVHTDNLFVERAVEPEAYDKKIAGRMFANMLRFNLIRKAGMLNDIGLSFGVQETICSQVSWSLRRIARFLEDSEEKQADYLARYCCLAAASGALRRVYWGPIIGQREGLIDDGTTEFPEIPHVTFYGRARGNVRDYRIRPAFSAFQTVNRFIAGARYIRKIPSERGLEIHEFCSTNDILHAAWTMNGRRVLTRECYPARVLEKATFYSRDGATLADAPAMITESPIYIKWSGIDFVGAGLAQPACPDGLRPAKPLQDSLQNIRFVQAGGMQYDFITRGGLSGVCRVEDADVIIDLITALKGGKQAGAEILRDSRNRVWRIMPGADEETAVVIKQFRPLSPARRLFAKHKGDKALRSWNSTHELLRRGIFTPLPIAFFHDSNHPLGVESWYVCEDFDGSFSIRNAFNAFSAGADKFEGISASELYSQIALFIRKMHDRGVYFRDLSAGNLLFRRGKEGDLEFALIDTARAIIYDKSIGLRQRLCDLMRLCHPLCWKGRRVFIGKNLALIGRRYRAWMNVPFYYYDLKHWIKRKFRRQKNEEVKSLSK